MTKTPKTYTLGLGLGVDQLLTEGLVILGTLACAVDNNLLVVVRELVDDIFVLLVELQVIICCYALLVDGGSVTWNVLAQRGVLGFFVYSCCLSDA